MKNARVKFAMLESGITQKELAKMFNTTQPHMSEILGRFELAKKEQDEIIRRIKESRGE